jgi:hypothetical protein
MDVPAMEADRLDLGGRSAVRHHRDERQADKPGEIGFGTAVDPLVASISGVRADLLVAQRIEDQRTARRCLRLPVGWLDSSLR